MCTVIASETLKARKPHRCSWCGESIEAGSKYHRQRVVDGPDASVNKLHPECYQALAAAAAAEGGCVYFNHHGEQRGEV